MTDHKFTPPGYFTRWRITHHDGTVKDGHGMTAFDACQSVGWGLGEVLTCVQQRSGYAAQPTTAELCTTLLVRAEAELCSWDQYTPQIDGQTHEHQVHRAYLYAKVHTLKGIRDGVQTMTAGAMAKRMEAEQRQHEFHQARMRAALEVLQQVGQ